VNLTAPFYDTAGTDTIAYDHTGNADGERILTLTCGTWPTWAAAGMLQIGSNLYKVEAYRSSTVLQLDTIQNPSADVSSTTDWKLIRNSYPLPRGFMSLEDLHQNNAWGHCYIQPDDFVRLEREIRLSGKPFFWTVLPDPKWDGGFRLRVAGYPATAEALWFLYRERPSEPSLAGVEAKAITGTVTCSSGRAWTGSGTSFDSSMVGAYLRVSADASNEPTGLDGSNPYVAQHKIWRVDSTTAFATFNRVSSAISGQKFVVSHHLDLEPGMHNAMLRSAEYQLAVMVSDAKTREAKRQEYLEAVRLAIESDMRVEVPRISGSRIGGTGYALYNQDDFEFGATA